jgi:hypothetical protein
VEISGRERLMIDGKAGKAVRYKIHSLEACGGQFSSLGSGEGRTRRPREQAPGQSIL